jgi:threonine aldolase
MRADGAPRFLSDNVAGAHPAVLDALASANAGDALPYGDDALSRRLDAAFSRAFGAEVAVIPCVSGTAANALALSLVAGPVDAIAVHAESHVYRDECNAPEFFTGGARLTPIAGADGKLDLYALEAAMAGKGDRHAAQPAAISLAQATESGTVYSVAETRALGDFARRHGLKLHMDGARIANAVAALGVSPAEATWKAGIDVLSFGATKNGGVAAEAVVLFDPRLAEAARYRAKRSGQLLSKMRFVSAQLLAMLEGDLWLANAAHANAMAARLAQALAATPGAQLVRPPQANMVFVRLPERSVAALQRTGLAGYVGSDGAMRLCASWRTAPQDIDALLEALTERGAGPQIAGAAA